MFVTARLLPETLEGFNAGIGGAAGAVARIVIGMGGDGASTVPSGKV
jgi:hypothetical protein